MPDRSSFLNVLTVTPGPMAPLSRRIAVSHSLVILSATHGVLLSPQQRVSPQQLRTEGACSSQHGVSCKERRSGTQRTCLRTANGVQLSAQAEDWSCTTTVLMLKSGEPVSCTPRHFQYPRALFLIGDKRENRAPCGRQGLWRVLCGGGVLSALRSQIFEPPPVTRTSLGTVQLRCG